MQNCNKCSLKNDNIYNYTTFQNNYNKNKSDFIIEGLENNKANINDIKNTGDLTNENTKFNKLYAEYLTCSIPNTDLCKSILTQYNNQTDKVENLNQDKTANEMNYTTCDNLKNRCEGINIAINNTNANIRELNDYISKKNKELATCEDHKKRCEQLGANISNKNKEIYDLENIIKKEKSSFKKNLCNK